MYKKFLAFGLVAIIASTAITSAHAKKPHTKEIRPIGRSMDISIK